MSVSTVHTYGYYMNFTVVLVIIVANSLDHVLVTMATNAVLVKFIFPNNWVRHLKAPKISQTFRVKTQLSILSIINVLPLYYFMHAHQSSSLP